MEAQQLFALTIFGVVYLLIASRWIHRALAATLGAVALALWVGVNPLLGAVVPEALVITAGLMVIAGAVRRSGIAAWAAIQAARLAGGRPGPLLVGMSLLTFVLGALLGPAPAVVLVVPVALLLAVELDVDSLPFVLVPSWAALLGSLSLVTAQPAWLWLASALGLSPAQWWLTLGPLAVVHLLVTLLVSVGLFGRRLRVTNERRARVLEYDATRSLGAPSDVVVALSVVVLVFVGLLGAAFGLPVSPSAVVLVGATVVLLTGDRTSLDRPLGDLDGGLLVYYGGLMIVVAGLAVTLGPLWLRLPLPPAPALLGLTVLAGGLMDHGAVVGALVPWLKAANLPHGWVAVAVGTTLGGAATVWGSASVAAALALGGQGSRAPSWKRYTGYGLILAAVNGAIAVVLMMVG